MKTLRLFVRNGFALAIVAAAPMLATAQQAPMSSDAQIVVRDAGTGALRAATAEEAQALRASPNGAVMRRAMQATQSKVHGPSGARGVRLTDEFMSYSVFVKQADGSVAEACYGTREEAEAALKSGSTVSRNQALPTE